MTQFFNTGLTEQEFLDQYWQKKPLLIRQAFSEFESPISPDDLAGLAGEDDIESRLIEEHGEDGTWSVRHGPFFDEDFEQLPETHWTMLVQDVDKHLPETRSVLDPFAFIPDWRRDDLMVSYAPEHGSVGAHTDGYDVFLLQAHGQRRWQVSAGPIKNPELLEGLDVQIMADFEAHETWDLSPGDILYVPPHYAHHGVALNECMTFSIGFRSPSQTDLLDAVVNTLLEQGVAKDRYADPDLLVATEHSHRIDQSAIERVKALLHQTIDEADGLLMDVLGKFVTETKSSLIEHAEQRF
jgi:50S ribosomal protein L16 3-hydroxylase